jgi:glycosyltransferase involved in cell wall biosynthesis
MLKSIALIISHLRPNNLRLQPWRYLCEVAAQLHRLGHAVTLIGDEAPSMAGLAGITVQRLASARNPQWKANRSLANAIRQVNPDIIIWHVGLTSFLHQNFDLGAGEPSIGIFTSPLYELKELMRLSPPKLIRGYQLSGMALMGSLLPSPLLRARMSRAGLEALVVQTETTRQSLQARRLWLRPLHVIPPGVDEVWRDSRPHPIDEIRRAWGYSENDTAVVYFGSPAPLRGLPTLLEAFKLAQQSNENLKLVVLSRQREGEFDPRRLKELHWHETQGCPCIQIVEGMLSPERLASVVAACDVVTLPFELVPSDAPLSLLEGRALGKPLITTRVTCLPELAGSHAYLAKPGSRAELTYALLQAAQELKQGGKGNNPQNKSRPVTGWEEVGAAWSQLVQNL